VHWHFNIVTACKNCTNNNRQYTNKTSHVTHRHDFDVTHVGLLTWRCPHWCCTQHLNCFIPSLKHTQLPVWGSVSLVLAVSCPLRNWLNRSICHLGWWLGWTQWTMYYMGADPPWKGKIWRRLPSEKHCVVNATWSYHYSSNLSYFGILTVTEQHICKYLHPCSFVDMTLWGFCCIRGCLTCFITVSLKHWQTYISNKCD